MRYSRDYELGISRQNCHGDGNMHAEYHVGHPGESGKGKVLRFHHAPSPAQVQQEAVVCK